MVQLVHMFSQFDASEHAPLVSRVTADTNHRVNEMSRISGNVADLYNNHRLTILLGSLLSSHTYVNEDAILFEKKQQEQNNTSHATITRPCQQRGRGGFPCRCFVNVSRCCDHCCRKCKERMSFVAISRQLLSLRFRACRLSEFTLVGRASITIQNRA